jgi:hypothetical protein
MRRHIRAWPSRPHFLPDLSNLNKAKAHELNVGFASRNVIADIKALAAYGSLRLVLGPSLDGDGCAAFCGGDASALP